MASITVLKGKKFCVEIDDANKRDDYVLVTLYSDTGKKVYHHLTTDEALVFAFSLKQATKKKGPKKKK